MKMTAVLTGLRDLLVFSDTLLDAPSFFKYIANTFLLVDSKIQNSIIPQINLFQIFMCNLEASPF